MKQCGAAMSSKLIPPNVGAILATVRIKSSLSSALTSISKTSISANFLNNTPLPSITGLPASEPTLPSPKTAVPSVITAIKFPLLVYWYANSGLSAISLTGAATPGLYASAKSSCSSQGFVGTTDIFPALGCE